MDESILESQIITPHPQTKRQKVYLCLGTDKLVFDSLGPIVGSLLKADDRCDGYVYGTIAEPVTALQVEKAIEFIRRFHVGAEVIVIDSAIGKKEEVGKIKTFDKGLRPALGIDRQMAPVGDKSIMGIITTKDNVKQPSACNVKLSQVYDMAKRIVNVIFGEETA